MLQLVRAFADATSRAADAANRTFHLYVHERFRAEGLRGAELMAATQTVANPLVGLIEPAVLYFHRKGWERATREDMILHLIEESTAPSAVPGELITTVLFVDLSSFTPLSDAMGDTIAAQVLGRFAELVREATARCDGQVVMQIGDAFHGRIRRRAFRRDLWARDRTASSGRAEVPRRPPRRAHWAVLRG